MFAALDFEHEVPSLHGRLPEVALYYCNYADEVDERRR